ncbi:MAG: Eco57I restriction-modification methylase domain-containing protein [Marinilabiliaceae bacterium]|nr:Eco57I restriction-modification methylase domain-containing protein [Marinilabiliaceae bacterium]
MLFQKNIVKKYVSALSEETIAQAWSQYKSYFLNADIQTNIRQSKEEQFQEGFLRELFVKVLGYTLNPSPNYNLITEQKNETNSKKADGAILVDEKVVGVIELKDHKTTDLSKIEQQAFGYKNQNKNAVYVVISNFEKLRFYIENAVECIEFDLFHLTEDEFRMLWLCLAYENIAANLPKRIKTESVSSEDAITNALYRDYSTFKQVLFDDICKNNCGDACNVSTVELYKKTQKLLDRLLFIFFAEDSGLLQPNTMVKIIADWEKLSELDAYVPLYDRIKKYFGYLDTGYKGKDIEIFAYNGGLFKPDEVLDNLTISDDVLATHTRRLADYDYKSEVDVNILGHIFENSLNEVENVAMQSASTDVARNVSTTTKRKRDGVFYTPQYITKYIVENTVGRLCTEKKAELGIDESEYFSDRNRRKDTIKALLGKLDAYREWLLGISICDPACGSGAFLNAALQFLIGEHHLIDEMDAKITGSDFVFPNIENSILENNLFGVDINEESVEIAKLALWLRTAKPNRKLNSLNKNIKCGNSLIADPEVAGDKAFDWAKEFPQVFAKGGFDVVIGNPPYVQLQSMGAMSDVYAACGFESYNKSADLYCLFTERGYNLLKPNGLQSFIMPNKWMLVDYGKELRRLLSKTALRQILNFGDIQFFQDATTYVCIFVTRKSDVKGTVSALSLNRKTYHGDFMTEVPTALQEFDYETFGDEPWIIRSAAHTAVLNKMQQGKPLKDLPIAINYGIKTGFNDAFFIDGETRSRLIAEDAKSAELIKPLLRGRDIQAWVPNDDLFLINPHNGVRSAGIEPINIDDFPAIKMHLNQFYDKLAKRFDKGITPYNLRNCDYLAEFSKPKIMYPNMTSAFPFIFDDKGFFGNDKTFMITATDASFDLKALAAIFNSKLCKLWIWYNCPELQGGTREIRKVYFENFPVPESLTDNSAVLAALADKMLALNSDLQQKVSRFLRRITETYNLPKVTATLETFYTLEFKAFTKELEKQKIKLSLMQKDELEEYFNAYKAECVALKTQIATTDAAIDNMVYQLYGLTEEEIKVVEGE